MEGDGSDSEEYVEREYESKQKKLAVKVCLWEYSQNDPKRDSGMKLCRLGYAKSMKPGKPFAGIVLSAEASRTISIEDADLLLGNGIAGINCSWNRIDEVPTGTLGKARNQRRLPFLLAANTVNYGKPWKMNTAEAIAAALYVAGFKQDAQELLYPFSYGPEFLRLNEVFLEAYGACQTEADVVARSNEFLANIDKKKQEKELRNAMTAAKHGGSNIGGYMDDMDLPPMDSDEYDEEEDDDQAVNEGC